MTLKPRTAYTFVIDEQSFTFTSGDGEDHTPPATPELQGVDYSAGSACGPRRAWSLQLAGGDDAEFVLAQLSSSDELADAAGVAHVRSPTFATATCGTNFEPPEGSSFPMAVQVMDLAGNLSGLSTTRQVSGCATTPGLTVFLMLAWLIRRARG